MFWAVLMAFREVENRHALQPPILPPLGAGSHLTTTVLGKVLGHLPSEVPNRGCPIQDRAPYGSSGLQLLAGAQTGHLFPLRWHSSWPGGLQRAAPEGLAQTGILAKWRITSLTPEGLLCAPDLGRRSLHHLQSSDHLGAGSIMSMCRGHEAFTSCPPAGQAQFLMAESRVFRSPAHSGNRQ